MALTSTLVPTPSRAANPYPFPVTVGARPPALEVGSWLRNGPVAVFQAGKVTIVDSWASWCGPCKSVMPRLSELNARYGTDVVIVGIDVFEFDRDAPVRLIERMGDQLTYPLARDTVPPGGDMNAGAFVRNWLEGSGQYSRGIPLTFIVDRGGRIAWIGNPRDMDGPVDSIVKGTWDVDREKQRYETSMRPTVLTERNKIAFYHAVVAKDPAGVAANIDTVLALDPVGSARWVENGFVGLHSDLALPDRALAFTRKVMKEHPGDPLVLAHLANTIMRVKDRAASLTAIAQQSSANAHRLSPDDYYVTMVRAVVLSSTGQPDQARSMFDAALARAMTAGEREEVEQRRAAAEKADRR